MLKVILVDDESKSLKSITWDIENFCKDVEILASFTDPVKAIDFLRKNDVDCVFLDVEMPQMDGFGFLNNFFNKDFFVVFVTAYDGYALQAIKEEAADYLLKPVDRDELIITVEKIKSLKKAKNLQEVNMATNQKFALPAAGKIIYVRPEELLYCQSDGNYTRVFLTNGENIYITKKIKEIHSLLDNTLFCRVHNSYVINMLKVTEFLKTDSYVILDHKVKVPVSRSNRGIFLENN